MAKWKSAVITDKGKELMAKVLSGSNIEFTSMKTSDHVFSGEIDFEKVTLIPSIRQSNDILSIDIINNNTVSIYSSFDNKELTEGYHVKVLGLYALDPDTQEELLYSISTVAQGTQADYLPTFNGVTLSTIDYKFVTAVGNSENVTLDITDQSLVTQQEFRELKVDVTHNRSQIDIILPNLEGIESNITNIENILTDKLDISHDKGIYEESNHGLRVVNNNLEFYNGFEWLTLDIDPKLIRDIDNVPLRVEVSASEPVAENGRIYLNTVDNLFYIARGNQWWRLFVGGDEKLEQDPPTNSPTLVSKTDTSVTLSSNNDMEFRFQGGGWQESSFFGNLNRNQLYKFEQRFKSDDVYKVSPPSPHLDVTTDKGTQTKPSKPTISDIDFDRVTVRGESNTEVRLNSGAWYDSPHTFTGLVEETVYTAYARKKETNDYYSSPSSEGVTFTTPSEQQIYGFEVDESNTNPRTAVTYIEDAVGMTPMRLRNGNMDYGSWEEFVKEIAKPVVVKNGVEQYDLNYNDYTKKATGGASVLTGVDGDVFTRLEHMHMKYEKTVKGFRWYLSTKPFDGSKSLTEQLENGYNQFNNPIMLTLQNLYLLLFKDRDSQTALGRGRVDGAGYIASGNTNNKGFFFGSTQDLQMKFLGIEDFYGNKFQWVDGIVSDGNRDLLIATNNFNCTGTGYTKQATNITSNTGGYFTKVQGGDGGYVLADTSGSETTGYADYGDLYDGRVAYFGGSQGKGGLAGAFYCRLSFQASDSDAAISARLCFKNTDAVYIGAYLGYEQAGKLRSITGNISQGNKTLSQFRTLAKANN